MSACASFSAVVKMLEDCAKVYTIRMATHCRVIHYNGKVYRGFPKQDEIEIGHIRKLVRNLEINKDCARSHIQNL